MIKPTATTLVNYKHRYITPARHIFYDTTEESQNPRIIREHTAYYIQWQNIWNDLIAPVKRYQMRVSASLFDAQPDGSVRLNWYRFAVSLVGVVDRNSKYTAAEDGTTHGVISSFNITHDATGADILVYRATADTSGKTVSATYNGASLTEITSITTNRCAFILYKGSPSSGSNTLTSTFSSADAGFGVITSYSGTAGTMSNAATPATGNTTSTSLGVTTTSGDVAVDCLVLGTAGTSITVGAGQTSRGIGADTYWHNIGTSEEGATGASTTMSWSWTGTAQYAFCAAKIDQASVATTVPSLASLGVGS